MTGEIKVGPVVIRLDEGVEADEYPEVLEWRPDVLLDGEPAGKLHLFEIDLPALIAEEIDLDMLADDCLGGAYKGVLQGSACEVWKRNSPLLVVEGIDLFPNVRGQGYGHDIVRAVVGAFSARGIGAAVLKSMPHQLAMWTSPEWREAMGPTIGGQEWFPEVSDGRYVAKLKENSAKLYAYWRKLGWREVDEDERVFLDELRA